jgi:uroporphyrinogen-III synthase
MDGLPLSGKRIVVTRAEEQSGAITSGLEKLGANVIGLPTIKIEPANLSPDDVRKVSSAGNYDAVVFTSVNAVRHLLSHVSFKKEAAGRPYVVAIGKTTAELLNESGIKPDMVPEKYTSTDMLKSLAGLDWKGKKVLIPKGNLAGSDVALSIRADEGEVDEIVVYNTLPNDSLDEKLKSRISSGEFDAVVFFSPSQAKNFLAIFGASVLKRKEIAVIGPTTKKAAENAGLYVDVVPVNSTTESLIASMVEHEKA